MSKLHPILFSALMVQALLAGRKTQTRRVFKVNKFPITSPNEEIIKLDDSENFHYRSIGGLSGPYTCPYGQSGDILWVRENIKVQQVNKIYTEQWMNHICIDYVASEQTKDMRHWIMIPEKDKPKVLRRRHPDKVFITPGIHMPKVACRLFLKIKAIRVERLQDITPSDAVDEGIEYWNIDKDAFEGGELVADFKNYTWKDKPNDDFYNFPSFGSCIESFKSLWQSINGEDGWDENPWVWVIEFERVEKPENFLA